MDEVDDDVDYMIHVVPSDGFTHEASPFCVCEPKLTDDDQLSDPDEDGERHILISYQHNLHVSGFANLES